MLTCALLMASSHSYIPSIHSFSSMESAGSLHLDMRYESMIKEMMLAETGYKKNLDLIIKGACSMPARCGCSVWLLAVAALCVPALCACSVGVHVVHVVAQSSLAAVYNDVRSPDTRHYSCLCLTHPSSTTISTFPVYVVPYADVCNSDCFIDRPF